MRRRTRSRFKTIDAENEEEFIKEYDKMRKSRLSELNFQQKVDEDTNNEQDIDQDDDYLSPKKMKKSINLENIDSDEDYLGLGAKPGLDEDEDCVGQIYEDDEILKGDESLIKNQNQNQEEKGIEMLCYYLKNSVKEMSTGKGGESIFFNNKNKNVINSLSGNAIYDINIRDLVDNFLTENDNENYRYSQDIPLIGDKIGDSHKYPCWKRQFRKCREEIFELGKNVTEKYSYNDYYQYA